MISWQTVDRIASIVIGVAAVAVAAVVVEQRLHPRVQPSAQLSRVERIKNWQELVSSKSVALDDTLGIARVYVFTDFQCPFCRAMDSLLTKLEEENPGKISRSVVDFPIASHPHARAAALAFECAAAQGHAKQMHHVLYGGQSRIGVAPWSVFAKQAGVPDTNRFNRCVRDETFASRVDSATALGQSLSIAGTPAVVVNEWLFAPAMQQDVTSAIKRLLEGGSLGSN